MPNCILRYCNNHSRKSKKSDGISFHKFPRPGHEKREQWIRFVQNDRSENMWLPSEHTCICSMHFREKDTYITKSGRRYLKNTAVPVDKNGLEDDVYLSDSESLIDDPPIENQSMKGHRKHLNSSFVHVYLSDTESLIDDPSIEIESQKDNNTPDSSLLHVYLSESETIIDDTLIKIKPKKDLRKPRAVKKALIENKKKIKPQYKPRKPNLTDVIKKLKSKFPLKTLIEHEDELLRRAATVDKYINALKKCGQPKRKITYSACVRKFAITLNYYSAAAYKYVRKIYNHALPHPKTLSYWYASAEAEPGFTEEAFETLRLKSANALPEEPVVCSLVFRQMSIRQQKLFKNKKLALVNFGNGPQEKKATQVLVFMLVSLTENWKITVGYFLVAGIGAETKKTLIKICLEKCHKVGVSVVSLTFDGCKENLNTAEALGCQFSDAANMKTHFSHPSTFENVYVFIDLCHVIELIRNEFENRKILFDENNEKVKWRLLVNLNKLQQNEGLKFANKLSLSPSHMEFRNQVMKAKLATQLLSMSVAKALELCDQVLNSSRFSESAATANFITLINNLFDILNSQSPLWCKNKGDIFETLNKIKGYILSLRIQVKRTRMIKRLYRGSRIIQKKVVDPQRQTGFVEAIICIESLKGMYREMVEDRGIMTSISTHRLSQYHLELFFGCIRKNGGNNSNPNVLQLRAAYKNMIRHLELKSLLTDSCIPLDNFSNSTTSSVDIINVTCRPNRYETEEFQVHENENRLLNSDIEASVNCEVFAEKLNSERIKSVSKLIVGYISGYVARKLVKTIKCEECMANITTDTKSWHHKLITLKDMGGLCYSSEDVFQICLKTEAFIRSLVRENGGQCLPEKYSNINYIVANTLKDFLDSGIFQSMEFHFLQQPATLNHRTHLIRAVIEKYSVIRLYRETSTDPDISFYRKCKKAKLILF